MVTLTHKTYKNGSRANSLFLVLPQTGDSITSDGKVNMAAVLGEVHARTHKEATRAAIDKNIGAGDPIWVIMVPAMWQVSEGGLLHKA